MAAARIQKICAICGENVTNQPRTKDPQGTYYCNQCWKARISELGEQAPISDLTPLDGHDLNNLAALAADFQDAKADSVGVSMSSMQTMYASKARQRSLSKLLSGRKWIAIGLAIIGGLAVVAFVVISFIRTHLVLSAIASMAFAIITYFNRDMTRFRTVARLIWPLSFVLACILGAIAKVSYENSLDPRVFREPRSYNSSSYGPASKEQQPPSGGITDHASSQQPNSVNAEFQSRWDPQHVSSFTQSMEKVAIFMKKDPSDTTPDSPAGKWSGTLVSASASPSDDAKYDAVGDVTVHIDHGDGTSETQAKREGRRRDTGKWEEFRKVDPAVMQFAEDVQPLVDQLQKMAAMRSIGGTIVQHADAWIALEAALKQAPSPAPDSCYYFIRDCRLAVKSYEEGIEQWRLSIKFDESTGETHIAYVAGRDKALAEADKEVANALSEFKEIQQNSKD